MLKFVAFGAGVKNLLEDEAVAVGGSNHSHATADLYDAIAKGDYPEWKLLVQVCRCAVLSAAVACNDHSLPKTSMHGRALCA